MYSQRHRRFPVSYFCLCKALPSAASREKIHSGDSSLKDTNSGLWFLFNHVLKKNRATDFLVCGSFVAFHWLLYHSFLYLSIPFLIFLQGEEIHIFI
jgi:hypothetical protein